MIGSYKGHHIFVRDESGNDVANTTVLDHDRDIMTVSIEGASGSIENNTPVTVLILARNGVHEYSGRLKRSVLDSAITNIALYKGKVKENRQAARFTVHTMAMVESLVINSNPAPLLNPLPIFIENLSASGALIKTAPDCFTLNAIVQFRMDIGEKSTTIDGQIVWIKPVNKKITEYGCRFIAEFGEEL